MIIYTSDLSHPKIHLGRYHFLGLLVATRHCFCFVFFWLGDPRLRSGLRLKGAAKKGGKGGRLMCEKSLRYICYLASSWGGYVLVIGTAVLW